MPRRKDKRRTERRRSKKLCRNIRQALFCLLAKTPVTYKVRPQGGTTINVHFYNVTIADTEGLELLELTTQTVGEVAKILGLSREPVDAPDGSIAWRLRRA